MEPDLPTEYKAAVFDSKDSKLSIKDIPLEYPKHGEVLVKVLACGVCYSDVEVGKGSFGNELFVSPFILTLSFPLRRNYLLTAHF